MKRIYVLYVISVLLALGLANISYFVPMMVKRDNLVFLARGRINSEDTYTYISTIEQVRQGRILTENQYTSEPQTPSIIRPSYIFIGNVAKIFNLSSLNAYHLFRIIFSIIFCIVLYKFLDIFFTDQTKKLTAFAIILTAGGLGWLTYSIDIWVPEAFAFLSFSEAPHFILSWTLILAGFYFFIKYLRDKNINFLLPMFITFFVLSFEHPFDLFVVLPVLLVVSLWNKTSLYKSIGIVTFSGIGLIYQVYEAFYNPVLKAWNAQNILLSPAPSSYLFGFGILVLFSLIGLNLFLEKPTIERKLILIWIGVASIMLYAPFNFQRRLVEGAQIPLAIAGTAGLFYLISLKKFLLKRSNLVMVTTILILSIGSFTKTIWDFKMYNDQKDYYYAHSEDLAGVKWLGDKTNFSDVILSNRYFGNLIPGLIGRKVFIGHGIQTINFNAKIGETNQFLLEKDNKKALKFLKDNHITYIFLGVNDSMIQFGFKPNEKPYLKKVYDKNGVLIFAVR